ncbi:hypothetical protein BB559_005923 [Furculomyces boomerangus]|uniref:Ribosomal protein bL31m N-terminal domain-containing protein n=2 Tax=Harpellales TaxID=61421 RepID=A0A2T9Y5U9_9FUNG|nr:hypothetical protein BB559_005923 [Furculomyces boomerangus]PWA01687.1 hypothetical protein BB558_002191 [Smittium angustum]
MRGTQICLKTKTLAKMWRPRPESTSELAYPSFPALPEIFRQRVVLSDGSTFTIRSTSPRAILKLSKDTRNHPLWNPQNQYDLNDEGGHLSRFQKRFGDYGNLDDLES